MRAYTIKLSFEKTVKIQILQGYMHSTCANNSIGFSIWFSKFHMVIFFICGLPYHVGK